MTLSPQRLRAPERREDFIRLVAETLDGAGVAHAFLHGYDDTPDVADTDVDVVVDEHGVRAVDAFARAGAWGTLVQAIDYSVPDYRWYTFATDGSRRPFRQLDVACDPLGIGRYGIAVQRAFERRRRGGDLWTPDPAAATLYLAVKRAVKRRMGELEERTLRATFASSPEAASALLTQEYGSAGAAVAHALASGESLTARLQDLRSEVEQQRNQRSKRGRRLVLEARRHLRRARHPSGLVVVIAGPDGSGKSSLAEGLANELSGAFRHVERRHVGPGLLPPLARLKGVRHRHPAGPVTNPHGRAPSGRLASNVRLIYLWADTLMGWPARVAAQKRRSTLVILERGPMDPLVDPRRYRIRLPRWAGPASKLLPKPDITFVLEGGAREIRRRKPELSEAEIERQSQLWRSVGRDSGYEFRLLDALRAPADVVADAVAAVSDRLALRQQKQTPPLPPLIRETLGQPSSEGVPYALIGRRGGVRWAVPVGAGAPGPIGYRLYRPGSRARTAGATAYELAHRLGLRHPDLMLAGDTGLAAELEERVGSRLLLGAALPYDSGRAGRAVLVGRWGGRIHCVVKVAEDSEHLEHESAVLRKLEAEARPGFTSPRPLDLFGWRDFTVLILEPLPSLGPVEHDLTDAALRGLKSLQAQTTTVFPTAAGGVAVHGDFTPWNSARTGDGRFAIWDWESAHIGHPLHDVITWEVHHRLYAKRKSLDAVVEAVFKPPKRLCRAAAALDVAITEAPVALLSYLEWALAQPQLQSGEPGLERRRARKRLIERMRVGD